MAREEAHQWFEAMNIETLEEIDTFPHLRDVNLSKNQLSDVAKLGNCKELLAVNLAGNQFASGFPDLGGAVLEHLQWVDLSANQLTTLGDIPHRNLTVINAKGASACSWASAATCVLPFLTHRCVPYSRVMLL